MANELSAKWVEPQTLDEYKRHVESEFATLERDLTRVLFGDKSIELSSNSNDPTFGKLAMVMNVVLNSERTATDEKERLLEELVVQQRETHTQNLRLDAILAATDDGMLHVQRDGIINYVNPCFGRLVGLPGNEIFGQTLEDLARLLAPGKIKPDDLFARISDGLSHDRTEIIDESFTIESPISRTLRLKVQPVKSPELTGYLLVLHDVTVVEEARRDRNDLLGNLAHEVRTPLTSIKGFVDLLRQGKVGELEPAQQEVLDTIANNVSRLTDLVRNMLDADRIRSNAVFSASTSLAEVVSQVLKVEQSRAERIGLELRTDLEEDCYVTVDRPSLVQVIHNLVSNAIKYTRDGFIQISVRKEDDETAILEVADSGIGILPEEQAKIFDRFYRSDHEYVYSVGGTGIGLSIVKSFVEAVGGTLTLASNVGEGSTFRVSLPRAKKRT